MPIYLETYQLLQQLLANTPDIVFFKDRQSCYLEFNDALLQLTGVPREVLLGNDTSSFLPRELTEEILLEDQEVMRSKKPRRSEQWVEFANGRLALMDTIISPIVNETGDVIGLLGIGRDITELMNTSLALKEKNLALEKANRDLDTLMYHGVHDLRAPLASMQGLVDLMRVEKDEGKQQKMLDMLSDQIAKLDGFTQDIIHLGKNQDQVVLTDKIDLESLFSTTVEQFRFLPGAARMQFDFVVKGSSAFYSDEIRLGLIFSNLISNGIRYSDQGKEAPFLRLAVDVHPDKAVFELRDNGLGIADEHQKKIFDMFYRAHNHSKGSGIGLYLVQETIHKIAGKITVDSVPGTGTTFTFEIPNRLPNS